MKSLANFEILITKLLQISISLCFLLFFSIWLFSFFFEIENELYLDSPFLLLSISLFLFGLWIILGMIYRWESYLTRPISNVEANGVIGRIIIVVSGTVLMLFAIGFSYEILLK